MMAVQPKPRIPVLDMSDRNLKPGSPAWISAAKHVQLAMEEFGCLEVIYYDKATAVDVLKDAFSAAEELFSLSPETKAKNTSEKPFFGYFGQIPAIPLYESLAIDRPDSLEEVRSFANLLWPKGNDEFCESSHALAKVLKKIDGTVMKLLFESYGIEWYNDYYAESVNYLLRYFKYDTAAAEDQGGGAVGLGPHADKSMISILHQKSGGLQIRTKDGEWIDIQLSPSSFLVLAGDALMALSNDRIPSCYHQVIIKGKEMRYSAGLGSFVSGTVKIPEELGDPALHYKSFDHFAYLNFCRSEDAYKLDCAIKTYAGFTK